MKAILLGTRKNLVLVLTVKTDMLVLARPKLKFYLFPLTRLTLEKIPDLIFFYFSFYRRFFFFKFII